MARNFLFRHGTEGVVRAGWAEETVGDSRKQRSPHNGGGLLETCFFRERRYADLGHLLPMFYNELAVEPGVTALTLG